MRDHDGRAIRRFQPIYCLCDVPQRIDVQPCMVTMRMRRGAHTAEQGDDTVLLRSSELAADRQNRPESISSRMATSASRTASCRISLRFFSPPENPSLTLRLRKDASMFKASTFGIKKP